MNKIKVLITLFAIILPLISCTSPTTDFQKRGITAYPASPNIEKPSQFSLEIKPGETKEESFKIENNYDNNFIVHIFGVDSFVNNKDETVFKLSSEEQSSTGKWIIPTQQKITLEPGKNIEQNFTISVPKDAELGEYLGGLSVETKNISNKEGGVRINLRKVLKVNIKVTDDPQPIEKMPPPSPPWQYIYLGASIALFIGVMVYLFISKAKKGKKGAKK